jgi:hypothetical protein
MGDVSFCESEWMQRILARIEQLPDRTFLIQSKNPYTFNDYRFPLNVLLGTTLETNRDDLYEGISKAPLPSQRHEAMLKLHHPRKIITVEPVLDFDVEIMEKWIREMRPEVCYIELSKVQVLIENLKKTTIVRAKLLREAWWERD